MKIIYFVTLFIFGLAQLSTTVFAQVSFGLKFGANTYQYRVPQATKDPFIGAEVGAVASFPITQNNRIAISPEFGYFLGQTRGILPNYLSIKSGTFVGDANCYFLTHFIQAAALLKYYFDENQTIGVYAGPDIFYLLSQTVIAEYTAGYSPDGTPYNVRENFTNPFVKNTISKFTVNARIGTDLNFYTGEKINLKLYFSIILQPNQYMWPTGAVLGVIMNFKNKS